MKETETIAKHVVDAAFQVHYFLGPGLLESTYQACFVEELQRKRFNVATELVVPVEYKGKILRESLRLDVLVENEIIVELKAMEYLLPVHKAQLITYLRLSNLHLGFLINFNVAKIKDGISRVVHNYR
ncbi:GxxExxY protein [Flavilitoribacter nigricans]|uniref:GxxExxY protein n=1 Tax=Flavilitoribacter nigricans (strain ATCC 23147 / DSM 23189 / NBRC 102662 / NCIMB 1420 / SS-2) TaxID=1122177 RepID=A0A2D0N2H5_FLAN2|nr:GxxExxY protein [Flavilitoribacter nigricans]PHN01933.1 GxxExxY protein [Flavilitoribacter nigricans DSM 23189 = NBRC 102662]